MTGGKRKGGGQGKAQPRPLGFAGSGAGLLCVRHQGLRAYALRHSGTVPTGTQRIVSTAAADRLRIKLSFVLALT